MKTYGGLHVWIHDFLTLATFGGERSYSYPRHITPGKESQYPGCFKQTQIFVSAIRNPGLIFQKREFENVLITSLLITSPIIGLRITETIISHKCFTVLHNFCSKFYSLIWTFSHIWPEMHVGPSFKMAIKHLLPSMLVSCFANSLTLKIEVTNSSEMYAEYQWTTRHHIPEDRALNFRSK
jgi:hypothetical protein